MNLFELFVKIGVDDQASGNLSKITDKLGNGLKTAAKVGVAAVTAAGTAIVALTKSSIDAYAEYEQLVGGVETLFEDLSWDVQQNAGKAFETAGLSANEYMSTAMSFAASLNQSLLATEGNIARSADLTDQAIIDMADNANKMGTSMEMIQNAYQGFAKQNYTMLDNLKLGYGGTKAEMERLLEDAGKLSGIEYDISSFADIVEAIHVVQTEMGIAGTTAAEASTTIEGSLGMMKAAWENLVVGIADDGADLPLLIDSFVESVGIAAQNLLPRIEQSLVGIGQLIEGLAPIISEALPVLVESVLPSLLTAAVSLVTALVNGVIQTLPALYKALLEGVQIILVEVFGVSEQKAGEFANNINSFFETIKNGFAMLVDSAQTEGTWLNEIWTGLQNSAKLFGDFLSALWGVVSAAFAWCVDQINTEGSVLNSIWEGIKTVISAAVEGIQGVITAFIQVLHGDWAGAWDTVVKTVLRIGGRLYDAGAAILESLWDGLKSVWDKVSAWWDGLTFSDKNANVNVSGSGVDGSHAGGLPYVPYDGYIAELHRGERILTANEAYAYNNQKPSVNIVQNIYSEAKTAADLMQEALYQQERAVLLGV